MVVETRFQENAERVRHGKTREGQIARALSEQHALKLEDATETEDKHQKIDRWLVDGDKKTAVQIKYRETGDDLLFEVFYHWDGFNTGTNKIGRDMVGASKLYAVLRADRTTVVMASTDVAKGIINEMLATAKAVGWTVNVSPSQKTLKYAKFGGVCELKVQRDPRDGRTKMVAYIPAQVFIMEYQAKVYHVAMPRKWQ